MLRIIVGAVAFVVFVVPFSVVGFITGFVWAGLKSGFVIAEDIMDPKFDEKGGGRDGE